MPNLAARPLIVAMILSATFGVIAQNRAHDDKRSLFSTDYSCEKVTGSLRGEDIEVLGFRIGSSTIRDVQAQHPNTHSVRLTTGEEAEEGICLKNDRGMAVVFATGVMGSPDTLISIYLAPARLVESSRLQCTSVPVASEAFASRSGIHVGAAVSSVAKIVHRRVPTDGSFCAAYEIASGQGPLQVTKRKGSADSFTDYTGIQGRARNGKLEWVKIFGITSN